MFNKFVDSKEPAFEIFNQCMDIVFDSDDAESEYIERLSKEARLVYLLWCFDGEIHNGGFAQLFFNSLGDYCSEILAGLKTIEANKSAHLLAAAMEPFPGAAPSQDREVRWKQLEPFEDNEKHEVFLNRLDNEFYKYEDNLSELLHNYVRSNTNASINA